MSATLQTSTSQTPDTGISIAYDYSPYYERIATALETIATNSTSIKNSYLTMASNVAIISTNIDAISTNVGIVSNLANTSGIHTIQPYTWLGSVNLYRNMIEEAGILEESDFANTATQILAKANVDSYLTKIKTLPEMWL